MSDRSVHEQDSEIFCSNRSSEEELCLLGHKGMQVSKSQPTFRRNISHPSSQSKCKRSNELAGCRYQQAIYSSETSLIVHQLHDIVSQKVDPFIATALKT
jgi:hypothetical protein